MQQWMEMERSNKPDFPEVREQPASLHSGKNTGFGTPALLPITSMTLGKLQSYFRPQFLIFISTVLGT